MPSVRKQDPKRTETHTGGSEKERSKKMSTDHFYSSEMLRALVEDHLGRRVNDDVWERSESYARRKLEYYRERQPEVYTNWYLVLLTADTVKETEFSDFTEADCEAKMKARSENK